MLLNTEKQYSLVVKDMDSKTNLKGLNQLISMSVSASIFLPSRIVGRINEVIDVNYL